VPSTSAAAIALGECLAVVSAGVSQQSVRAESSRARALGRELLTCAKAHHQPAFVLRVRQRERLERAARLTRAQQPTDLRRRIQGDVVTVENADRDRVRVGSPV
jgi:hypothetical protein